MDYTYSTDRLQWRAIAEKPLLAFDPTGDFAAQKKAIRERLLTQLGDRPVAVPPEVTVEYTHDEGDYIEHRLSFWAEEDARAVCLLCIPKLGKKKISAGYLPAGALHRYAYLYEPRYLPPG